MEVEEGDLFVTDENIFCHVGTDLEGAVLKSPFSFLDAQKVKSYLRA